MAAMDSTGGQRPKTQIDSDEIQRQGSTRNFVVLILYNVLVRVGWIFKTESIVMPAVMDAIAGGGWLRGCLPMLNRLGQSVVPVLASDRIRQASLQKRIVTGCAVLMGFCFLSLFGVWWLLGGERTTWLPALFLAIYACFWICVGVHNLSVSLVYGKLVRPETRGRLMLIALTIGATIAICCAWLLMRPWLDGPRVEFVWMFLCTGLAFMFAAAVSTTLVEVPDQSAGKARPTLQIVGSALQVIRSDANFRRLAWVAGAFGMSITLFPHYQAYARESLNLGPDSIVLWVIAQNLGAAMFSIPIGFLADRLGNRLVLKLSMLVLCVTPMLTIVATLSDASLRPMICNAVFFLLGLTPVTMRTFNNYTLEIVERARQPIYLSTLGFCLALPVILFSTIVGALIDWVGFEAVFVAVVAILMIGWILTFGLIEPRDQDQHNPPAGRQTIGLE